METTRRLRNRPHDVALRIAFAVGKHGEFGYFLLTALSSALNLPDELVSIVTLSMAVSSQSERDCLLVGGARGRETMDEDYSDANRFAGRGCRSRGWDGGGGDPFGSAPALVGGDRYGATRTALAENVAKFACADIAIRANATNPSISHIDTESCRHGHAS